MWKYILKRVLWLIPSLLAVSLIICFLAVLTPGEPAQAIPDAVPDECRLAAQEAADSCPVAAIDIRA